MHSPSPRGSDGAELELPRSFPAGLVLCPVAASAPWAAGGASAPAIYQIAHGRALEARRVLFHRLTPGPASN